MKVESYSFGSMTVNGQTYHSDLIVFPDRICSNWWRKQGHVLSIEDLDEVLRYEPAILVVGCGAAGCMTVPPETKRFLREQEIEVVDKKTQDAYLAFNGALSEGKKVVGAFHLTC